MNVFYTLLTGLFPLLIGSPLFVNAQGVKKKDFVTPEEFGITGNNKDDTEKFNQLIKLAKSKALYIRLTEGKTYVYSPLTTVDITGMKGFSGKGTLDLSKTGGAVGNTSMTAVFQVTGAKKLLQASVSGIVKGANTIKLNLRLTINKGDVLFLTSSEPLGNLKRPYYAKGQRLKVIQYNPSSGELQIEGTLYYSINNACLWLNAFQPEIHVEKEVRFITSPMNFISCFRIYYAKAFISGNYKNFALTAIMYKSSEGVVSDMEAELMVDKNNGYSHCIQVADMSDVLIKNCRLSGGRHVVSGVGGGLWEKEECNGQGHAGYPSVLTVDGGIYKGTRNVSSIPADIGTVDSHGLIEEMIIRNCTIYGGINLGANNVLVENVIIYTDGKRAFNVGSDVLPGSAWGNYTIKNVTIYADNDNALLISKSDIQQLVFEKVIIRGNTKAVLMDFRNNSPKSIEVRNIQAKGMTGEYLILSNSKSKLEITNPGFSEKRIKRIY